MSRRSLFTLTATALLAAHLVGCAAKPKPATMPAAPSPDQVQMLRETYKTTFPAAKVGVVTTVLSDEPYAMVNDIDTAGLKEGDFISFLDADQTVIASGTVVKVNPTSVAVMFQPGVRPPAVGDAAVKF